MEVKNNPQDFYNLSKSFTITFEDTPNHDIDRIVEFLEYHQFIYKKYPNGLVVFNRK